MEEGHSLEDVDIEQLIPEDLDAAQYPRYPENGSLEVDYNDGDKNAAIEEIERSLAESILTALSNTGSEQTLEASNNWIQQTTILPQNNNSLHNGAANPAQAFSTLNADQNFNISNVYGDQLQGPTEMVCKVTAMCPNYFSSQPRNSPASAVKEEPTSPGVSPRPCSNPSTSGHSHAGENSSCGEDFSNINFDAYCTEQAALSSSSDEGASNSNEATPKAGARRHRRRYSRDAGLSPAELQRRERRREQNRRAAEKCRLKNKAKNDLTLKEYQDLQSTNTSLQGQVRALEKQRQDLQDQLDRHMATCPLLQGQPTSTASSDPPPQQGRP